MARLIMGAALGMLIFLAGIRTMTQGLRALSRPRLRWALEHFTGHPLAALGTGAILTALTQSSSGTAAAAVGLVDAGLLELEQAFGIILGANIGTTLTGQLLSLKWQAFAPFAICTGGLLFFVSRHTVLGRTGAIVAGAGGLLWGIDLVGLALRPLAGVPLFTHLILQWETSLYSGILAGMILTATLQSSSAAIGLVLALAGEGLVGLFGGMAVVLGSNVGTVLTTLIASIGTEQEARQTAVADLLFNILGVLVFMPLFRYYLAWLRLTSSDVVHQIANGHTFFNLVTALVALPCIPGLAKLVRKLVPR
ncbi:MAG: Na/Pi cotransporter family protein [Firmicutes bacterium]|nr:Na/Pi cotransporter family protein [Bacillota bacterium]